MELDFYIPYQKYGIQSSYSLDNPETEEREVRALVTFHELYGLERAEIVTYSEDRVIHTPTLDINVVPIARWLIERSLANRRKNCCRASDSFSW